MKLRQRLFFVVLSFFFLGLFASYFASRSCVRPARADTGRKVFLIGDSQGWLLMHDLPRLAPSGTLIQGAPVQGSSIISWARGDHAKEMAKLKRARPDIILVVLGTNDAYMGPRIIGNEPPYLAKLLRDLKKTSKNIVWIGPPKLQARPAGFAKFKEMMLGISSQDAKFVDSSAISIAFWGDKMHCARPDPDGCEKWAKWIVSTTL